MHFITSGPGLGGGSDGVAQAALLRLNIRFKFSQGSGHNTVVRQPRRTIRFRLQRRLAIRESVASTRWCTEYCQLLVDVKMQLGLVSDHI